jgi:hypothetical protein
MWDSPLFYALMLEVGFQDVDADGTKEILVKSAYTLMNPMTLMLTIFDTRGRELTRQGSCEVDPTWGYDEVGVVCPVVGQEITIDDSREGKRDLLVREMDEVDHPKLNRYSLRDGHFVNVGVVKQEQP